MGKKKKNKFGKEELRRELKEALDDKLVQRREGPLLGAAAFSVALWGSKIFTSSAPGTSVYFWLFGHEIHFHHFHYGIIAIAIAIVLSFIEGPWPKRLKHIMYGVGGGFLVDEYWMLLTLDDTTYFGSESQLISTWIGIVCTIVYVSIALLAFFLTRRERKLWGELYKAVKDGKAKIDI
ncbi:MAG: hypothetical protein ACTSRS_09075 [Candidatus Helarchaeota archaeon]